MFSTLFQPIFGCLLFFSPSCGCVFFRRLKQTFGHFDISSVQSSSHSPAEATPASLHSHVNTVVGWCVSHSASVHSEAQSAPSFIWSFMFVNKEIVCRSDSSFSAAACDLREAAAPGRCCAWRSLDCHNSARRHQPDHLHTPGVSAIH